MHRSTVYIVGVLVSALMVVLLIRLAAVQSAAGTAYPPFSSHRADAQGLKAFHDVVELVGRTAIRNYLPLEDLQLRNTTVIKLGMSPQRIVATAHSGPGGDAVSAAAGNTVVLGIVGDCHDAVIKEWQLTLRCGDEGQYLDGPGWTVLARGDQGRPIVIERKFGSGEIILVANSRILNNRALSLRPRTELVATLAERRATVLFDEEHLGVADSSSVGKLLRHYRLHGVMLAALLLFGLFVWKNTSTFLPRVESPADEIYGRETTAGLANLLRRTVPMSGVVAMAIGEWAKAVRHPVREQEVRRVAASHDDPVAAYNAVASALHPKRTLG